METTLKMSDQPLTFTLTVDEVAALNKQKRVRMKRISNANKKMAIANWTMSLLVVLGLTGLLQFYDIYSGKIDLMRLNIPLILLALSFVGFIIFGAYQRKFYLHASLNEHGHTLRKQTISFSEDGVVLKTAHSSQSFSWDAILDFESTINQLYLYIDNDHALTIPKRALGDEAAQAKWVVYINDLFVKSGR